MCVILVCPPKVRPSLPVMTACHDANPHGIGVAWREHRKVVWHKNLSVSTAAKIISKAPGEVIVHFRWASVGGVNALLCHPFPVTAEAEPELDGRADAVLFHNGTWTSYDEAAPIVGDLEGPISDSRVAAALAYHRGHRALMRLPGRWAVMRRKETELYGDWQQWRGMLVSNTAFTHRLPPVSRHLQRR